ncbi:MAG: GNAT family N-acetyltransferase [Caldilineaceae bacterium]
MQPDIDRPFRGLLTSRLLLRPFRHDDVPTLIAYRNDPAVMHFQGWDAWGEGQAHAFVAEVQEAEPGTAGQWYQFAIEERAGGVHIGDVGLHTQFDQRQHEIGYTVAPAYQGRGHAREAVGAVVDYAVRHLTSHRVTATLDDQNHASAAVIERLGFRCEAHLLQNGWYHGRWCDEYSYAILAHEWLARHPLPLFHVVAS